MKKTFQIHLRTDVEAIEQLKKEAEAMNLTLAELCRQKLGENHQLTEIRLVVLDINKKLNMRLKIKRGATK